VVVVVLVVRRRTEITSPAALIRTLTILYAKFPIWNIIATYDCKNLHIILSKRLFVCPSVCKASACLHVSRISPSGLFRIKINFWKYEILFRYSGRTLWTGNQPSGKVSTYIEQRNIEKWRHTSMHRARFEHTIPALERPVQEYMRPRRRNHRRGRYAFLRHRIKIWNSLYM
jgi:hypothetical protein